MRAWRGWITIAALTFPVVLLSAGPACGAVVEVFDWTRAVGNPADGTIADSNTTDFLFSVGDIGTVQQVEIRFSARHGYLEDLKATLISPQGTSVVLFSWIGGPSSNFQDTFFTDDTDSNIDDASPPFAGTYKLNAGALLSDFDGQNPDGNWTLRIVDSDAGSEGTLVANNETVDWGSGSVTADGTQLFITIPEPATLGLLALAGGWALRRRRRVR